MGEGDRQIATRRELCTEWGPDHQAAWDVHTVSGAVGVPAPTLRTWDRRHDVGASMTTPEGRRRYSCNDVDHVVIMAHHVRRGLSPADAAQKAHATGPENVHHVSRGLARSSGTSLEPEQSGRGSSAPD